MSADGNTSMQNYPACRVKQISEWMTTALNGRKRVNP